MEMTARLTGDAKISTLKNDKQVVNFNVAINDSYKAKGSAEPTKIVTYVQCDYWVNPGIAPASVELAKASGEFNIVSLGFGIGGDVIGDIPTQGEYDVTNFGNLAIVFNNVLKTLKNGGDGRYTSHGGKYIKIKENLAVIQNQTFFYFL